MNRFRYLLFDLDGTLTDSQEGIINCFRHTSNVMGVPMPENIGVLFGPPLGESFERYFGMNKEQADEAVRVYRERYGREGLFENRVYDGISDMLRRLRDAGFQLAVATCKAEIFAVRILEKYELARYFTFIGGAATDGSRTSKTEVIEYVLENMDSPDKNSVLMIGDRDNDVTGAHKAGVKCLGVLWGYGSEQELSQAGADFITAAPQTLTDMLIGKE